MTTKTKKKAEVRFIHDKEVKLYEFREGDFLVKGCKSTTKMKPTELLDAPEPEVELDLCTSGKPSALFEVGDITGQKIFGFQTPKRTKTTGAITNGECTEETLQREAKTPYSLRRNLKKKIIAAVAEEESDISASDSEWEDDDSSGSSSTSTEDELEKMVVHKPSHKSTPRTNKPQVILQTTLKSPTHTTKRIDHISTTDNRKAIKNYALLPEGYFLSHASSKVRTSNRTLNCLRTPRLLQEQLNELLAEEKPSHFQAIQNLELCYQALFAKWTFALEEGFNILLYGVGSKRKLMSTFRVQFTDPTVVVNGFFPSLTIQEVLDIISRDVLGMKSRSTDLFEAVDVIRSVYSSDSENKLYLFVHNIDGPMLRNSESQEILAALAGADNIHLVATVDHINAPLMWDQALLSQFNFLWWDATTLQPYTDETAFEGSLLVQRSGGLALSSLQNVFRSLTNNAKSIFLLMAQYQLNQKETSNFSGMPFRDLYSSCRDSLLVSSDLALRSQLTEFLDHRLVRTRRGADGSELLLIPIKADILSQFVEQQQGDLL
ncbi:origin recognition complex subunit 2 [Anabrus simplex]|uniref:origin recognition complex subunit 2 n=1 Tax=Anabrus simplex TaxID=316456 RepID=UPI0035A337DD